MIFFISDTHFLHANMLKFTKEDGSRVRPFDNLLEMHETIIQNWNAVIKPHDHVWHLGDVTFQYNNFFSEIMSRLNGKLRMLVGNHDKLQNPNLFRWFEKVEYWRGFKAENFVCTHVPLRKDNFRGGVQFNVHGHIHEKVIDDPQYINVCVEQTEYTPVSMDEILAKIKDRSI